MYDLVKLVRIKNELGVSGRGELHEDLKGVWGKGEMPLIRRLNNKGEAKRE